MTSLSPPLKLTGDPLSRSSDAGRRVNRCSGIVSELIFKDPALPVKKPALISSLNARLMASPDTPGKF